MSDLRSRVIKLAHAVPELRRHLVPLLRKDAGFKDRLKKLWEAYKKEHPDSKKPPESLVEKAKGEEKAPEKPKGEEKAPKVPKTPEQEAADKKNLDCVHDCQDNPAYHNQDDYQNCV